MRIAQFRSISGDYISIFDESKTYLYSGTDYIRISPWTDVTFDRLDPAEVHAQLAELDAVRAHIDDEMDVQRARKVAELNKRRTTLLALLPDHNATVSAVR